MADISTITFGRLAYLERQFRDGAQKQIRLKIWESELRIGWKLEFPLEQQLDSQIWRTVTDELVDRFERMMIESKSCLTIHPSSAQESALGSALDTAQDTAG